MTAWVTASSTGLPRRPVPRRRQVTSDTRSKAALEVVGEKGNVEVTDGAAAGHP